MRNKKESINARSQASDNQPLRNEKTTELLIQ